MTIKRKFMSGFACAAVCCAVAPCLVACKDDATGDVSSVNGVYYMYAGIMMDGELDDSLTINFTRFTFKDGKVDIEALRDKSAGWQPYDMAGIAMSYTVSKKDILLKSNMSGATQTMRYEYIADGVYKCELEAPGGASVSISYLCKPGCNPEEYSVDYGEYEEYYK